MSGIYLHIPFCAQACHYCDFHFSTNQSTKPRLVEMLCKELEMQKNYHSGSIINTIYFGGGTPSLLTEQELQRIMEEIHRHYRCSDSIEITLEANPEDLTEKTLDYLVRSGINRLSIGIQSFDEQQLKYMNRSHTSTQAKEAVIRAQTKGFDNISIDLIYGIPSDNHAIWEMDLEKAMALNIQHISTYCLTIEPSTHFGNLQKKGILAPENEDYNAQQYEYLQEITSKNGFDQYEVSNFCRPGFMSRHNSNYWKNVPYLGVGPGAHSYNGSSRQFNIKNNVKYINSLENGILPFELEELDEKTKTNEYIMTSLRTSWGIDEKYLVSAFGIGFEQFSTVIEKYEKAGLLQRNQNMLLLTKKGLLFADKITEDLFLI